MNEQYYPNYTADDSSKQPLLLRSSEPLPNSEKKLNILYFAIAIPLGLLFLFFSPFNAIYVFGIGILVAWGIKNLILKWKCLYLRRQEFLLPNPLPYQVLFSRLAPLLTPLGMTFIAPQTPFGAPTICYKNILYDIKIDYNRNVFHIHWRMKLGMALLTANYYFGTYRKLTVAMGVIANSVQKISETFNAPNAPEVVQSLSIVNAQVLNNQCQKNTRRKLINFLLAMFYFILLIVNLILSIEYGY